MISVIIPSYNHEKYIAIAIDSVLGQSYSDLELIIIDDGSSDSSAEIINSYADTRVISVFQENEGAHAALNRGLKMATGDYLTILNSDDSYHQDRLKECIAVFENHTTVDFISSWINVVDQVGKTLGIKEAWLNMEPWAIENKDKTFISSGDYRLNALMSNFVSTTSNMIFKREVYEKVGGMRNLRFTHDWDFLLRVCESCHPYNLPKQLVNYRIHGENTIATHRNWMLFEICWIAAAHIEKFSHLLLPKVSIDGLVECSEKLMESFNFQGNEDVVRMMSWQIGMLKQKGIINPEEIYLDNEKLRNKVIEYIKDGA